MLEKISDRFRLDARLLPSSPDETAELREYSPIDLPDDYVNLIRCGSELEFAVDCGEYLRIWGASGCIEMNDAYEICSGIPSSLAIGDNEGGSALLYAPHLNHPGIYLVGFGCLDIEESEYVAPNLTALLVDEVGIENFIVE